MNNVDKTLFTYIKIFVKKIMYCDNLLAIICKNYIYL